MKVYIVGVDTGSPSGLLASPYMEKELNVLGYQVEQFPAKDADSLMQALMPVSYTHLDVYKRQFKR